MENLINSYSKKGLTQILTQATVVVSNFWGKLRVDISYRVVDSCLSGSITASQSFVNGVISQSVQINSANSRSGNLVIYSQFVSQYLAMDMVNIYETLENLKVDDDCQDVQIDLMCEFAKLKFERN